MYVKNSHHTDATNMCTQVLQQNMSENHGDNTNVRESADQEKRQDDDARTTSYGSANMNRQLSGKENTL